MEFHGPRTQILDNDSAENTAVVIYTVPVGKKFWLIEAEVSCDAGAIGFARAAIRNDSDVIQRYICCVKVGSVATAIKADHFNPAFPVELPAGWDLVVSSDIASLIANLGIFGFETNE